MTLAPGCVSLLDSSYDSVIVGTGSAGCVVTRRLVDGTDATVLLLEGVNNVMQADALIRQRGA